MAYLTTGASSCSEDVTHSTFTFCAQSQTPLSPKDTVRVLKSIMSFTSTGAKYCDKRICLLFFCPAVCLSVRSHISETARPNFIRFLCVLPVAVAESLWRRCDILCILLVLSTMLCIHMMGPVAPDEYW